MGRPVKWSRELHSIRERAAHARTETWSRVDIEELFGIGRRRVVGPVGDGALQNEQIGHKSKSSTTRYIVVGNNM